MTIMKNMPSKFQTICLRNDLQKILKYTFISIKGLKFKISDFRITLFGGSWRARSNMSEMNPVTACMQSHRCQCITAYLQGALMEKANGHHVENLFYTYMSVKGFL